MTSIDARQMGRKGAGGATGSLACRRASGAARAIFLAFLRFGDRDLDIFQDELQLVGIELLRALAEPRTLVFLHEQLKALDELLRRSQFALDVKACGEFVVGANAVRPPACARCASNKARRSAGSAARRAESMLGGMAANLSHAGAE